MQQITVAVNPDEYDQIQRLLKPGQTVYALVKDILLRGIADLEKAEVVRLRRRAARRSIVGE